MKRYNSLRMETFSDAVIAIIITIMVLDIPLPDTFSPSELLLFLYNILVFLVSFIIVGTQWHRHHYLFSDVETVTSKVIGRNMLFLFHLSLIPLLAKWVFLHPQNVIPIIAYDADFILTNIFSQYLWSGILSENPELEAHFITTHKHAKPGWVRFIIMVICLLIIIALSTQFPFISIIFFMAFPVIISVINIFWKSNQN